MMRGCILLTVVPGARAGWGPVYTYAHPLPKISLFFSRRQKKKVFFSLFLSPEITEK